MSHSALAAAYDAFTCAIPCVNLEKPTYPCDNAGNVANLLDGWSA